MLHERNGTQLCSHVICIIRRQLKKKVVRGGASLHYIVLVIKKSSYEVPTTSLPVMKPGIFSWWLKISGRQYGFLKMRQLQEKLRREKSTQEIVAFFYIEGGVSYLTWEKFLSK